MASNNLIILLLVISAFSVAAAQDLPPCVSSLTSCIAYLNSTTTPTNSCCDPLKEAALKQTACLCNLLNNKDLLKSFSVTPEQGLALAKRCKANVDASVCSNSTAPSTSPGGSTSTPSNTTGGKTASSAQMKSWNTLNGFICLIISLMLLLIMV